MNRPAHQRRQPRASRLFLSLGVTFALSAQALTLGKLSVLSSLGQPLIAEIDVPEISADEANSIRVGLAGPEAYKSAGLDYTADIPQMNVVGKRRTDGRAVIELRSSKPIHAPYLDVVLEVTWNTGRMLRDYTVLLDPPASVNQALVVPAPTLPIQSMSPNIDAPSDASQLSPRTVVTPVAPPLQVAPSAGPNVQPVAEPSAVATTQAGAKVAARTVSKAAGMLVKRGDTAAAIALANKPEGASLDQMLVAMLRANPEAFVAGNVNRLKAGAILNTPSAVDVSAVDSKVARDSVLVQARDFNEYRRKLAANVASTVTDQSARTASGKVTAKVTEQRPGAAKDDRLTLAKPTETKATKAVETQIAQERTVADAKTRANEIQKNIDELNKLKPAIASSASSGSAPSTNVPQIPSPAASAAASTPVATAPVVPAPIQATPNPPLPKPPVAPRPPVEQSLLDQIILSPLTLPIAGLVGVLVALAGWLSIKRRRKAAFSASQNSMQGFVETRQPSDTIFGPMGASDVDTQELTASASMVYSASQLAPQTTGGVDPIAEADVYLAYNRDVQAEEILKAAKAENPKRVDVQIKLLELYVKRRDIDSFDTGAAELRNLTSETSEDWKKIVTLAKEIGSINPVLVATSADHSPAFTHSTGFGQTGTPAFVPSTGFGQIKPTEPLVTPTPSSTGLIDFDMNHLSLEIPEIQSTQPIADAMSLNEDPKLALAEEYLSIGDRVGAKLLIEQVIAQNANPQAVSLAHQMLAKLG